jgi:cytidine deaminase
MSAPAPELELEQQRALLREAEAAMAQAYAPYSGFAVGAALLAADGRVYRGCNVENASFGLTVCAERVALGNAVTHGERDLRAVAVVTTRRDVPVAPCGACRQVLAELTPDLLVVLPGPDGPRLRRLSALLPDSFGPEDLPRE